MKWCQSCILPDTRPNLVIEEDGVCNACKSHKVKKDINWSERSESLAQVIKNAKKISKGYDCLIPVSGGKDSTWQTIKCLEYGLKPLAVTWKSPARTEIGQQNLDNLIALGVDHIDYQINPKVEARFMWESFKRFGSTALPMHMAIFNIPLSLAVRFNIPLVIWGENSAFEYGAKDEVDTGFRLNRKWLETYGVTHGTTARDWVSDSLSEKDLAAYFGPDDEVMAKSDIHAIFLGYYLEWDPQETQKIAKEHGFKSNVGGARTGYYDFADIDDDFIAIHHWVKWYKFGFTRLFDNLSLEIRNGRISRDEAIEVVRKTGEQKPVDDIRKFCDYAQITEEDFYSAAEKYRNMDIWHKKPDGSYFIPDFLISDWDKYEI